MTGEERAAELRAQFDRTFALPAATGEADSVDLLHLRVGGDHWAVRLTEVSGLVAGRTVVPVPSRAPGLLGLAGIRGEVVPVFGLASLLGTPEEPQAPRWLLLSAGPQPLGFAFAHFEGFVRVPTTAFHPAVRLDAARPHSNEFVSTGAEPRALISVAMLVATLRNRQGPSRPRGQ